MRQALLAGAAGVHLSPLERQCGGLVAVPFPRRGASGAGGAVVDPPPPARPAGGRALFIGTLFPVLGFCNVFPFLFSFVADHFQYLASLGLIALASAGIAIALSAAAALGPAGRLCGLPCCWRSWRS